MIKVELDEDVWRLFLEFKDRTMQTNGAQSDARAPATPKTLKHNHVAETATDVPLSTSELRKSRRYQSIESQVAMKYEASDHDFLHDHKNENKFSPNSSLLDSQVIKTEDMDDFFTDAGPSTRTSASIRTMFDPLKIARALPGMSIEMSHEEDARQPAIATDFPVEDMILSSDSNRGSPESASRASRVQHRCPRIAPVAPMRKTSTEFIAWNPSDLELSATPSLSTSSYDAECDTASSQSDLAILQPGSVTSWHMSELYTSPSRDRSPSRPWDRPTSSSHRHTFCQSTFEAESRPRTRRGPVLQCMNDLTSGYSHNRPPLRYNSPDTHSKNDFGVKRESYSSPVGQRYGLSTCREIASVHNPSRSADVPSCHSFLDEHATSGSISSTGVRRSSRKRSAPSVFPPLQASPQPRKRARRKTSHHRNHLDSRKIQSDAECDEQASPLRFKRCDDEDYNASEDDLERRGYHFRRIDDE